MDESKNGKDLFIHLLLRLGNYNEAAVLWVFLKNGCDVSERGTTSGDMHFDELGQTVSIPSVKRTIQRLKDQGFIHVRSHKNTKTLVSVNREKVLELLRQPLNNPFRLPGLSSKTFAFLDAWNTDEAAMQAASFETMEQMLARMQQQGQQASSPDSAQTTQNPDSIFQPVSLPPQQLEHVNEGANDDASE